MIDKFVPDIASALAGIEDGAVILVGGFGTVGIPNALIEGLVEMRLKNLTIAANDPVALRAEILLREAGDRLDAAAAPLPDVCRRLEMQPGR